MQKDDATIFFEQLLHAVQEMADKTSQREPEPLVYNIKQAAKALQISPNKVYELAKEKKIPVKKIGERVMIPKKRLEQFINDETEAEQ